MNHPAIARRSLLTAAGCALLRPAAASSGHERLQNKTYAADIIVIGFGAAGASAAIEAARAGSSVLILEKSPQKSHCSSTRMSSGIYLCPDRGISEEVLAQYIASTYLPDGGVSYREGKMDPDLTALARIWAKLGPQTYEWLHSLDPDFRQATSALFTTPRFMRLWEGYRPHLQGLIATYGRWKGFQHSTFGSPKLETSGGEALYACLNEGIRSASGISIRYAFQATELIADGDAVIGVRAVSENSEHQFLARQAVILTCGGFAFNRTMRASLLPASGTNLKPVLKLEHFSGYGFEDINFEVYPGEILGVAGLVGAGRTELATTIFGREKPLSGKVLLEGKDVKGLSTRDVIAAGINYVPEDRRQNGVFGMSSVAANTTSSLLFNIAMGKVFLNKKKEQEITQKYIDDFRTKVTGQEQSCGSLSGGNQQKVVIGRCLSSLPKLVILDEPTRGIDAAARGDVYSIILELKKKGVAIMLISSDMEEIIELSDRAVVMFQGHVTRTLSKSEIDQNTLMNASFDVKEEGEG